jgi:hypothetical protein
MYSIDDRDTVIEITDIPPWDTGAPLPTLMCTDHRLVLTYFIQEAGPWHPVSQPGIRDASPQIDERVALVEFVDYLSVMFGFPNDEAFLGHPLAKRGLRHYGAFRVADSSWIRSLAQLNTVHPNHYPGLFEGYAHFILAFHDSTFECIAEDYVVTIVDGPRSRHFSEMLQRLQL